MLFNGGLVVLAWVTILALSPLHSYGLPQINQSHRAAEWKFEHQRSSGGEEPWGGRGKTPQLFADQDGVPNDNLQKILWMYPQWVEDGVLGAPRPRVAPLTYWALRGGESPWGGRRMAEVGELHGSHNLGDENNSSGQNEEARSRFYPGYSAGTRSHGDGAESSFSQVDKEESSFNQIDGFGSKVWVDKASTTSGQDNIASKSDQDERAHWSWVPPRQTKRGIGLFSLAFALAQKPTSPPQPMMHPVDLSEYPRRARFFVATMG
ncbi:hypothetical protein OTU49_007211 [Cherax quadricarinatus]|uniref:Uncharacterized protein n=1 Tax=Cherax quadricarinatus TaxID=27406 RepID=A0AAW0WXK7_CHEQU|nr:uncharacterized protein LOC128698069 [Cherax quadricarinatus]